MKKATILATIIILACTMLAACGDSDIAPPAEIPVDSEPTPASKPETPSMEDAYEEDLLNDVFKQIAGDWVMPYDNPYNAFRICLNENGQWENIPPLPTDSVFGGSFAIDKEEEGTYWLTLTIEHDTSPHGELGYEMIFAYDAENDRLGQEYSYYEEGAADEGPYIVWFERFDRQDIPVLAPSIYYEDYGIIYGEDFEWKEDSPGVVSLDFLVAYYLGADGAYSDMSSYLLHDRFIESPDEVLEYIALVGDSIVREVPAEILLCQAIVNKALAEYEPEDIVNDSYPKTFLLLLEELEETYQSGKIAELLELMRDIHDEAILGFLDGYRYQ